VTRSVRFPGGLKKIGSVDPTFKLQIAIYEDDQESEQLWLSLTAPTLVSWLKMKTAIFKVTNIIPSLDVPKRASAQEVWEDTVNALTTEVDRVDAPLEASEAGVLLESVYDWVGSRPVADSAAEFEAGNRRYETPGGLTVFRARDLRQHLEARRHMPEPRVLWEVLSDAGFGSGVQKVDRHPYKVWWTSTDQLRTWIIENRRAESRMNGKNGGPDEEQQFQSYRPPYIETRD
jgi:hypothetical protein